MGCRKKHNTDFCHGRQFIETRNPAPAGLRFALDRTWYLVSTAPRREARAREGLMEAGCTVFVPTLHHLIRRGWRKLEHDVATFPGYLFVADVPFVQVRAEGEPRSVVMVKGRPVYDIREIEGVVGVVGTWQGWQKVPASALRFVIDYQNKAEPPRPASRYKAGDTVMVIDGPFMDFQAVVVEAMGREQAKVLISIFGRSTPVVLDEKQFEAA